MLYPPTQNRAIGMPGFAQRFDEDVAFSVGVAASGSTIKRKYHLHIPLLELASNLVQLASGEHETLDGLNAFGQGHDGVSFRYATSSTVEPCFQLRKIPSLLSQFLQCSLIATGLA